MSAAAPRLHPLPPHEGAVVAVAGSPFWIGAARDAGLALFLPGIAPRHVALVARADGYWLNAPSSGASSALRHNGHPVAEAVRLADGDTIELLPGIAYRFRATPTLATAGPRRIAIPAAPLAAPLPAAAPPRTRWRLRSAWQRWRRRPPRRGHRGAWHLPVLGLVAVALLAAAVFALVRAVRPPVSDAPPPPLLDADAAEYDRLTQLVADHVERGAALLELGAPDPALHEFGAAVTALESSRLRDNVWVHPRIVALEAGIAAIYRERRVPTPARYRDVERAGTARLPVLSRSARLSPTDFSARLADVQTAFAARFGRPLVVTGRDHAEHIALYGAGGAVDLRVRDLTRAQIAFTIDRLRAASIRVKDFSADATLQAQVAAAMRAGLSDRASTGLHLHVDRYADWRDRWTVP